MKIFRWIVIIVLLGAGSYVAMNRDTFFPSASSQSGNPTDQWLRKNAPAPTSPRRLQSLYNTFIRGYWVPKTGLFLSFPGTSDKRISQQAAIYDEGIAGILCLAVGDTARAQKMVDFFAKTWEDVDSRSGPRKGIYGLSNFYNAYYGVEGIEKTMHVGPNAWIGLLASRLHRRTGNAEALELALKIAEWMITKVPHAHGAIAMGQIPWNGVPWPEIYSTENNLSTYSFLNDLLKATDLPPATRDEIEHERDGIRSWLLTAYQPANGHVIRGFNSKEPDTAGAIDSYTWYTDALQPTTLRAAGIPVENLATRAQTDYTVSVDGKHGVDCIDVVMAERTYTEGAKNPELDKSYSRPTGDGHRLVWYEGTGQYIVFMLDIGRDGVTQALAMPAGPEQDQKLAQAKGRLDEAKRYTDWVDEAAIRLPWGTTYPCATGGQFYVYGWPAPPGTSSPQSDAVAAIVWRLFSGLGYEPLTDRWLGAARAHHLRSWVHGNAGDPHSPLLYGASEEMTVQSWKFFEQKDYTHAKQQAEATIAQWESFAHQLETKKVSAVHGFLKYDGTVASFQAVNAYWALNDVAADYFILGRIHDLEHDTAAATKDFLTILHDYPLAQVWDPKGWFWNPMDAIKTDFIETKSESYHALLQQIPKFTPTRTAPES